MRRDDVEECGECLRSRIAGNVIFDKATLPRK